MENLKKEIGLRVRRKREEYGWTREQFAEKCELSLQFLADVETGKSNMTTVSLYKVTVALGVSADYIVFGTDSHVEMPEITAMLSLLSKRDLKFAENRPSSNKTLRAAIYPAPGFIRRLLPAAASAVHPPWHRPSRLRRPPAPPALHIHRIRR